MLHPSFCLQEAWRLWNHTITVAVLTRRWIKRHRDAARDGNTGRGQVISSGPSPPTSPPKQTPRSGMLPPVSSPGTSPRIPAKFRSTISQSGRQSRGVGEEGWQGPGLRYLDPMNSSSPGEEIRPSANRALLPSITADSSKLDSRHTPGSRDLDRVCSPTSADCLSELNQLGNLRTGDGGRTRRQIPHIPSLANVMPTNRQDD